MPINSLVGSKRHAGWLVPAGGPGAVLGLQRVNVVGGTACLGPGIFTDLGAWGSQGLGGTRTHAWGGLSTEGEGAPRACVIFKGGLPTQTELSTGPQHNSDHRFHHDTIRGQTAHGQSSHTGPRRPRASAIPTTCNQKPNRSIHQVAKP
jgi:hypothetical protein